MKSSGYAIFLAADRVMKGRTAKTKKTMLTTRTKKTATARKTANPLGSDVAAQLFEKADKSG